MNLIPTKQSTGIQLQLHKKKKKKNNTNMDVMNIYASIETDETFNQTMLHNTNKKKGKKNIIIRYFVQDIGHKC